MVIQESVGHCAVASAWSDCTNQILRDYFEFGVVPKNGTVCESKCKPWQEQDCGMEFGLAGTPGKHDDADGSWFNPRFPLKI